MEPRQVPDRPPVPANGEPARPGLAVEPQAAVAPDQRQHRGDETGGGAVEEGGGRPGGGGA